MFAKPFFQSVINIHGLILLVNSIGAVLHSLLRFELERGEESIKIPRLKVNHHWPVNVQLYDIALACERVTSTIPRNVEILFACSEASRKPREYGSDYYNEDHSPFLIRRVNRAARGLGDALSPGKDLKYSIVSPPRDFAAYFVYFIFGYIARMRFAATFEFPPRDARGHYNFSFRACFANN